MKILFGAVMLLALSGCVQVPNYSPMMNHSMNQANAVQQAWMNATEMQAFVVKGKTTKDQILQKIGPPNFETLNSEGEQVWTYARGNIDMGYGNSYWTTGFTGKSGGGATVSTSALQMRFTFGPDSTVKDYWYGRSN
jgi:hypothetical protein